METGSRAVVSRGWGWGASAYWAEFLFGTMKKFYRWTVVMAFSGKYSIVCVYHSLFMR
jgi:hypothetical protein